MPQEDFQTSAAEFGVCGVPGNAALKFGETEGGQQYGTVMLDEFVQDGIGTIAGMDRDVCVDQVSQDIAIRFNLLIR